MNKNDDAGRLERRVRLEKLNSLQKICPTCRGLCGHLENLKNDIPAKRAVVTVLSWSLNLYHTPE